MRIIHLVDELTIVGGQKQYIFFPLGKTVSLFQPSNMAAVKILYIRHVQLRLINRDL